MVIGASRAQPLARAAPRLGRRQDRAAGAEGFDVHVDRAGTTTARRRRRADRPAPAAAAVGRRRRAGSIAAWVLALVGLPAAHGRAGDGRAGHDHAGDRPAPVPRRDRRHRRCSAASLVGVVAALVASLLANWYFVEPIHTFTISDPENVDRRSPSSWPPPSAPASSSTGSRRRSREALQARAEAGALARTSGILIGEPNPLPELLDQLRTTFSLESVSLLSNRDDGWVLDASAGDDPPTEPFDGERWDLVEDGTTVLVLRGAQLVAPTTSGSCAPSSRTSRSPCESRRLAGRSRRGGPPGRGRPAAHGAAPSGEPRPAHPAGVDQGVGHQHPPIGRGLGRRAASASSPRPSTRRPIG